MTCIYKRYQTQPPVCRADVAQPFSTAVNSTEWRRFEVIIGHFCAVNPDAPEIRFVSVDVLPRIVDRRNMPSRNAGACRAGTSAGARKLGPPDHTNDIIKQLPTHQSNLVEESTMTLAADRSTFSWRQPVSEWRYATLFSPINAERSINRPQCAFSIQVYVFT